MTVSSLLTEEQNCPEPSSWYVLRVLLSLPCRDKVEVKYVAVCCEQQTHLGNSLLFC